LTKRIYLPGEYGTHTFVSQLAKAWHFFLLGKESSGAGHSSFELEMNFRKEKEKQKKKPPNRWGKKNFLVSLFPPPLSTARERTSSS
jgi:hypothetical protein